MPIYEYRCRDCAQLFEEWQKDYQERSMPCPVCGSSADRIISNTSFVLKGGGWYADLYSKGGAKSGEASGSSTSSASTASSSSPASSASSGSTASTASSTTTASSGGSASASSSGAAGSASSGSKSASTAAASS